MTVASNELYTPQPLRPDDGLYTMKADDNVALITGAVRGSRSSYSQTVGEEVTPPLHVGGHIKDFPRWWFLEMSRHTKQ